MQCWLDDGHGMEATMMAHNAGWHKTCHLKFNKTKIKHLQGKSGAEAIAHISSAVHTGTSCSKVDLTKKPPVFSAIHQQALHASMNVPPMILI